MISSYEVGLNSLDFSLYSMILLSSLVHSLISVLALKILIFSAFVTEVFFWVDDKNDLSFLWL